MYEELERRLTQSEPRMVSRHEASLDESLSAFKNSPFVGSLGAAIDAARAGVFARPIERGRTNRIAAACRNANATRMLEQRLRRDGYALIDGILDRERCAEFRAGYVASDPFRSRVVMERYTIGKGDYPSFACGMDALLALCAEHGQERSTALVLNDAANDFEAYTLGRLFYDAR